MKIFKPVAAALIAAMAFLSLPAICAASDSSDVVATVRRAAMAFNKGDMASFIALCDSPASALDDFPPYEWHGATACADWASALSADMKKNGVNNTTVVLGTPWRVVVVGSRAYVVCPATLHYNQNAKPMKETGSVLTVALRKTANGWRMAAWSWSQHL